MFFLLTQMLPKRLLLNLLCKAAAATVQSKTATKYKSTLHLWDHTVIVESLFSTVGHLMTPYRNNIIYMNPSTFEMLLLLKVNKNMYNASTLDEISKKEENGH